MTLASQTLHQTIEQAAQRAGLAVLTTTVGSDFHGKPTSIFRLGSSAEAPAERTITVELSDAFAPNTAEQQKGLATYLEQAAKRLRNPNPNAAVTLAGLP